MEKVGLDLIKLCAWGYKVSPPNLDTSFQSDSTDSSQFTSVNSSFSKRLVLPSEQLALLNLKPGENQAQFTVTTKMQGSATVACSIHLWEYNDVVPSLWRP